MKQGLTKFWTKIMKIDKHERKSAEFTETTIYRKGAEKVIINWDMGQGRGVVPFLLPKSPTMCKGQLG